VAGGDRLDLNGVTTDADSLNAQIGRRLGLPATQQRQAVTQGLLEQARADSKALAAQFELDRDLKNIQAEADAYRASGLTGATGDVSEFIPSSDQGPAVGLRVGSRLGLNLQTAAEGLNPNGGVIDQFARGFSSQGSDWSVLEGETPLSYSLGSAARSGLGLIYDGLTGAGDFRAAGQAWSGGDYVAATMYGARGVGSAGLTAMTLGDYALARASVSTSLVTSATQPSAAAISPRHVAWGSDLGEVSSTIERLGIRALRQSNGNAQLSEQLFETYLTGVGNRLTRVSSEFGIEIQPAAIAGGERVPNFIFLHRAGPNSPLITGADGSPRLFAYPGSRRLDAGVFNTTAAATEDGLRPIIAGFDITTSQSKPNIVRYYQEYFGNVPIYDIRLPLQRNVDE
jgi:hypothetical protein